MSSYHNLLVWNAQAARTDLAGYKVAPGAKAEITPDAINREIGESRTGRNVIRRFAFLLAVSATLVFAGIHGAGAQGQAGMFADADGMEPPDMGVAYTLPVHNTAVAADRLPASGNTALSLDVDGIEPPDIGVAFDTGEAFVQYVRRQQEMQALEITADADGIEPPDMGVAYDTSAAYRAYAERKNRKNRFAVRGDSRN
jgi:hypothetical protein